MKKLAHILAFMAILVAAKPVFADLAKSAQILADNEKAGIFYVVPKGYSNVGEFDGSHPYAALSSGADLDDSFTHRIHVYTIPKNTFTTLLKNAKTNAQAEEMFRKNYPFKPGESLVSVELITAGKERFTIMSMSKGDGPNGLRYRIAHLEKNNLIYVVEFVDDAQSFLTYNSVFDTFLRNFYVKDLSKKIPFTGKSISFQGSQSTMTFNLTEGYFVRDDMVNFMFVSNARNQSITLSAVDVKLSDYAEFAKVKNEAELLSVAKKVNALTPTRTETGAGNTEVKNAYFKTLNGQKMYVVDNEHSFVGMGSEMTSISKTVVMLKNNTVYQVAFDDLDTYADKHVDALLRTVKFKDSKRMHVK